MALWRDERSSGIKANPRFTGDQGIVSKPRVLCRVRDHQDFIWREQRVGAEGRVPGGLAYIEAHRCLEPLPFLIDETDEGDRRAAELCGEADKIIAGRFRRAVQNLIAAQRFEACIFAGRQRGFHDP